MDDFNISTLTESRNEYCSMLVSRLTPQIINGINSIFNDALQLCQNNDEEEKYLMTFQNFLGRIPKWNPEIINAEVERIIKGTNCSYLEDLLSCVHVTQLKVLTSIRTTNKQKKIEIDIPKLNVFIHKVYIEVGRKVYKNVFLFEQNIYPLQKQKNLRELEIIVKECILQVIRDNLPIESILKSYLEESTDESVEEIREEIREETEEIPNESIEINNQNDNDKVNNTDISNNNNDNIVLERKEYEQQQDNIRDSKHLNFDDNDRVVNYNDNEESKLIKNTTPQEINAPKDIERLEQISTERWEQRKLEEDSDDEDEEENINDRINILSDVKLNNLDVQTIDNNIKLQNENLLGDIVELN